MENRSPHTFHIPVMGLAYTIDSPVKVARFGIDSVISIIEDNLIERMRKHYYEKTERKFVSINSKDDDYRARRITDYLNLVNAMVKEQIDKLRSMAFETGSEVARYFEMLPSDSHLRQVYERMIRTGNESERQKLTSYLKSQIRPGRIDVNIMTKVDKDNHDKHGNPVTESSDALAALRGYANSELCNSSVILSAGLNPRLFNYLEKLPAFHARGLGVFEKEVVVKVSDYRSALIQGKYLAKKGIWVSEFRIESGLNCGGHAFATDGGLLGPILEAFRQNRDTLRATLHELYQAAANAKGITTFDQPHPIRITVQGGIGTAREALFLTTYYNIQSTGWGTPFLLCPEATTVDDDTLQLLRLAGEKDLVLSKASPLGVRFNYLKGTTAEKERLLRISKGRPGSPCTEKHLVSNTEFTTEPICTASHTYQKRKIEQLRTKNLPDHEYTKEYNDIVAKECLCIGLSNSAIITYGLPPVKRLEAVTVCPGPNLAYFDKIVTLKEMTDHIYGRTDLITTDERPHMFIKELQLNVRYLEEQITDLAETDNRTAKELLAFGNNLLEAVAYYRELLPMIPTHQQQFETHLAACEMEIRFLLIRLKKKISIG